MRRRYSLTVAICATIVALIFITFWIPFMFLLPIVVAAVCFDWKMSLFAGLAFGVVSMIMSFLFPGLVMAYFMRYPWLPILARLPLGLIAHFVYRFFKRVIPQKKLWQKVLPIAFAGLVGAVSNTVLVGLGLVFLPAPSGYPDSGGAILTGILLFYGPIEWALMTVVLPPLALALKRAVPRVFDEVRVKIDGEESAEVEEEGEFES